MENLSVRLLVHKSTIPRIPKNKFKVPVKFMKKEAPLLRTPSNLKIIEVKPITIANIRNSIKRIAIPKLSVGAFLLG